MVSTLSLFVLPESPASALDGDWRLKSTDNEQGLELGYADPDFDDDGWQVVRLPHLRHATVDQDTLWYRCHFDAPDSLTQQSDLGYTLLRLGGSFYRTQIWLNGRELGSHEGYFQPFGFDVTDFLRPTGNVIAVRCHFPVEAGSFKRKTAVAGIFTDWDCKPYPSQFYPHLPAPNEWTVPIGLWQPVCLYRSGPVVMQSLTILPEVVRPQWQDGIAESAAVRVKAVMCNLTADAQTVELGAEVRGQGSLPPANTTEISLAANEQREVELTLKLNNPRLWFPWTHGQPHLYETRLRLKQASPLSEVCYAQHFGVREIKAIVGPGQWEWWLNGRRVFLKGSNYVSDFYLDRVSPENLRRDLNLAMGANLDLLRVHAHIAPVDFYRLCDELGMLIMCDFPLIWTYGFNLPHGEDAAFRASVRDQVEDMVRLLGSHASIGLWSMHNEPPWTPDGSFLGSDVHESETNRQMDLDSAARVDMLDPTRPAISASGIYDQHLYHGWYTGHWFDNRNLHPSFPTEFGVQALPNLDSPFWATVNTTWPVDVEDITWAHSGYSSIFWVSPGVGAPAQYDTLAGYIEESQAYQAFYIRYVIDQWRRQKFSPTGGYIHFLFTDGWPAITWSVLDYYRLPKAGYTALAEASRPVRVCFDLDEGYRVERAFHLAYSEGGTLKLGLWLVNDDYRRTGEVSVEYWFEAQDGLWNRLRRALRWWRAERINTALPGAGEAAKLVHTVEQVLQKNGNYAFVVQTRQGNTVLDTNRLEFRVGEVRTHAKAPRHVPGLLVNRVYMKGSLQHTQDGFTFSLLNPAMPVNLIRLGEMSVDGTIVDPANVDLMRGGVARRASSVAPQAPLEIPSGERFTIVVRNHRLTAGNHEMQITAEFAGLGEVSAKLKDKLI
jgi:beta-mannosidase